MREFCIPVWKNVTKVHKLQKVMSFTEVQLPCAPVWLPSTIFPVIILRGKRQESLGFHGSHVICHHLESILTSIFLWFGRMTQGCKTSQYIRALPCTCLERLLTSSFLLAHITQSNTRPWCKKRTTRESGSSYHSTTFTNCGHSHITWLLQASVSSPVKWG